jgi:hypothetical protein
MPHPATQPINARLGNLAGLGTLTPTDFSGNLESNFEVSGTTIPVDTFDSGSTSGPGGTPYAIYDFMADGSAHLSVAVRLSSITGGGWNLMTSTALPFAPVTNKYFTVMADELAYVASGSAGNSCGGIGCLDANGNLHVMGISGSAVLLVFDTCVPLAW